MTYRTIEAFDHSWSHKTDPICRGKNQCKVSTSFLCFGDIGKRLADAGCAAANN